MTTTSPPLPSREHGLALLREMIRIRRFEERCAELYGQGKIRGFLHLYIGEEAVAVGALQVIRPDDAVVATYREHGQALARGIPATALMAEMYGKATGASRGRGGSMHVFDAKRRFYGGNAIVAGGLPLAVGIALADKLRGDRRVTICFFGDGALAEGEFHESLNLAALWRLPVLFLCENNQYAMGTAIERHQAQLDLTLKARGYATASESVDGMDVLAVEAAAARAEEYVRAGEGPFLLEAKTYRFRAHSAYDPELYRGKDEVERWKKRDPIALLQGVLDEAGLVRPEDVRRIEGEVKREVDEAVAFAEASPWEPVEDLLRHVQAESPPAEEGPP